MKAKPDLNNNYLKNNPDYFQKMIEEVEDYAILLLDRDGNIQSWNKGVEKIKGYSAKDILGKNLSIFYSPEDQKKKLPEKLIQEAALNGKAKHEGWRLRKDGSKFWGYVVITALHDEKNNVIGFSKVTRDLTERLMAEGRFRLVVEAAPSAIMLINNQGKITLINKQAETLFGYSRTELVGQSIEILIPQQYRTNHFNFDLLFKESRQRSIASRQDLFVLRKDGRQVPVEVSLNSIDSLEGNVLLVSIMDITERKITEQNLRQYVRKLEFHNKELEQFAYVASHDLQEPLRTITSFVDLLKEDYQNKLDEKADKYLEFISGASARMRELVKALLDYSRIGRERRLERVDCKQVMSEVISDLEAAIKEAHAHIHVQELPVLFAYRTELRIMLQNLITNGIKFRKKDVDPEIEVGAELKNDVWEFYVRDNGIGIEKRFHERIFSLFQRLHTRNEYPGIGIGLAHCKKIAGLHGGDIWVESEPNQGSTFYFTIPAS